MKSRQRIGLSLAVLLAMTAGCSLGQGEGEVKSDELFAHDCWGSIAADGGVQGAPFDLQPDFFAANPYRDTLQMRIQRGNDLTEVSDGLSVLIDDVPKIREQLALGSASTFKVAIPAGVTPPGSPTVPPDDLLADPPIVHMALYLQSSCHNQNTVLYAVSGTITFSALFSGDPNEKEANEKLTDATFEVNVGDLRDVPLGAYPSEIPVDLQTKLTGSFRFYFERGQPGQPFP